VCACLASQPGRVCLVVSAEQEGLLGEGHLTSLASDRDQWEAFLLGPRVHHLRDVLALRRHLHLNREGEMMSPAQIQFTTLLIQRENYKLQCERATVKPKVQMINRRTLFCEFSVAVLHIRENICS